MITILVTGANGFVGSHTLKALSKNTNVNLIAACRDRNKLSSSFTGEVREGDIRDTDYLNTLLEGVDVVVNAIAWTSLWGHKKLSEQLFLQPSIRLIDAFNKSRAKRFINISTTSSASPDRSSDAMSHGIPRKFWPHLCNVIKVEDELRNHASKDKTMVNMRIGLFAGEHYALGLLPILVPRMKTHLVPWVAGGKTGMPIIDGRDIAQAMTLAALNDELSGYESFNIVGPSIPKTREVIEYIAEEYSLPKPHFSVPFFIAYPFAWLMEKLVKIVPWEPLIVRSIIHLLEDTHADNNKASEILGYQPEINWKIAIKTQMDEMAAKQKVAMKMAKRIA